MDFWEWVNFGVKEGWCSEPVCDTHEGVPMTVEETEEWQQGNDNCLFVIRLWDNQ
jgi:predicted hydrocarbon binding protein